MNRTYNVFVDNGLYVVANYLDKEEVSEVTVEDLISIKDHMATTIGELLLDHESFGNFSYVTNLNSSYTVMQKMKGTREEKINLIKEQFNLLLNNIGNDKVCCLCGEKKVNLDLEIDRKYIPGIISQSFYNSSNNMQTVDICPICAFLSMLSFLNVQKLGSPTLYISDSDSFMKDLTDEIQANVHAANLLKNEQKYTAQQMILACCKQLDEVYYEDANYISQVMFANGQSVKYLENTMSKKQLLLLRRLNDLGLIYEFLQLHMFYNLLNKTLMVNKCYKEFELVCSERLYLEVEAYELKEEQKQIIHKIASFLYIEKGLEQVKKDFKLIKSGRDFINYLVEQSQEQPLFESIDELEKIGKTWVTYKDYIQAQMVLIHHKQKNGGDQ